MIALAALVLVQQVARVELEFVVTAPAGTDASATIYVAGNVAELGGWKPDGLALVRDPDGTYRAKAAVAKDATLEFKITCGSWATVEKGAGGAELPNRRHVATQDATLALTVVAWSPAATRRGTGVIGKLERPTRPEGFGPKSGLAERGLLVWLPPGYADDPKLAERRFPVLYLFDGQNLFDAATAFAGVEWQVDETCDRLVRAGTLPPLIVVGIENTRDRIGEYTPTPVAKFPGSGRAAATAKLLLDEVKPFVDARWRTQPDRDHTFVGGSSLGGLVSLWLVHAHADVFGGAAALSPSLFWDDEWLRREWAGDATELVPSGFTRPVPRLWIDLGTEEGAEGLAALRAFAATLETVGLRRERDFIVREIAGGRHDEAAWAARFEQVVTFLFEAPRDPRK